MLKVTKYGGNNYRIFACMFYDPVRGTCVGPWHKPWLVPDRPPFNHPPSLPTDLSKINDIVSWRYVKVVESGGMVPASLANPPLDKDDDFLLYNFPPYNQPDYDDDVYPFLASEVMWATDYDEEDPQNGVIDAIGAYDDGFVELEFLRLGVTPFVEAMADWGDFGRLPRNPDNTVNCSQALSNPDLSQMSYWERLIVYADCHTNYHLLPQRDYGPVHLGDYNFFDDEFLFGTDYIAVPRIDILNPPDQCYMPNEGTLGYSIGSKSNWPDFHAHAFVGVGIWRYYDNYVHYKLIQQNPPVRKCSDQSLELNSYYIKISRAITHELGHNIADFQHGLSSLNQRKSDQCPNDETVMHWYTEPRNASYFCPAEIDKLREKLVYPPG